MIEKIINYNETESFLKHHFPNYQITNDPYEIIAIYKTNTIIGVISYSVIYERGEINYIAVLENQRKKGIATKLLEYALEDLKKRGCLTLSLEVEENNTEAINLYLKFGFIKQTIRKNYYQNGNAYLMTKEMR